MGTEAAGLLGTRVQERILGETTINNSYANIARRKNCPKPKLCFAPHLSTVPYCTTWKINIKISEKTYPFSGAAEAGDELRDCFAGPHAELGRAGDSPQPRPAGARLPARREDDAQ